MAARGMPPDEIAVAIVESTQLRRATGVDLPSDTAAQILAALPGCDTIPVDLIIHLQEQIRRVHKLAAWLPIHAARPVAGLIVDAASVILLASAEDNLSC